MLKRIFTAVTAAVLALWLLFALGPQLVASDPDIHIVAQAE